MNFVLTTAAESFAIEIPEKESKNEPEIIETVSKEVVEEEPIVKEPEPEPEEEEEEEAAPNTGNNPTVGASFNPWVKKASAEQIAKLMKESMSKKRPMSVKQKKPEPVLLRISGINRNGKMQI
jgi:hypothetical protein